MKLGLPAQMSVSVIVTVQGSAVRPLPGYTTWRLAVYAVMIVLVWSCVCHLLLQL